jgi:hypothetical protein
MMKRNVFLLLFCLSVTRQVWATAPWTRCSAATKADAAIWQMRSDADLKKLVTRYINNNRACYYIINQAQKVGLEVSTAKIFRQLQNQKPRDSRLQILYAYATYAGGGPGSRAWFKPDARFPDLANEYGIAVFWLPTAIKNQMNSPEMLTMVALIQAQEVDQFGYANGVDWSDVIDFYKRSIKIDPSWADSYYGYGEALWSSSWDRRKGQLRPGYAENLLKAERALLRAQELDPGLKGSCARLLSIVARDQKQPKKQLKYMDILLKEYPEYKQQEIWVKRRDEVSRKLAAAQDN